MGYNNKFKNNDHRGDRKDPRTYSNDAPKKKFIPKKPVTTSVPFVVTGTDQYGNNFNAESAIALMEKLYTNNTFTMLSVMASMSKKNLFGREDAKGSVNVARVVGYDTASGSVSLTFFGKNVDNAEKMDGMVVIPHVLIDRATSDASCITGFEIVPEMDA